MYDGYLELINAIIEGAIMDYNLAVIKNDKTAIEECEEFFRSEWCKRLMEVHTDFYDPEKAIEYLRENAVYKRVRKKLRCGSCKQYRCIHKRGETSIGDFDKMICKKDGMVYYE